MQFEEITGVQHGNGVKTVIYGQEGVGKSTLAAQFPDPIFIDCEGSTTRMDVRRLPKPESWEMLQQELEYILQVHAEKHYQTVVIDTFDWAERLALQDICNARHVSGIEEIGYGKGWEFEAEKIAKFLVSLDHLVRAGIHITLLCHAITRKTSLPEETAEFDHWEMKLGSKTTNKIAPLLKEWSDLTLFLAFQTNVIATDNQGMKHKATSCERVMYTTKTAWWDAKNRFRLAERLPLKYAEIAGIYAPKAKAVIDKAKAAGIPVLTQEMIDTSIPIEALAAMDDDLVGIEPKLAEQMGATGITEKQIRQLVGEKGYFPKDMPVQDYPKDFIEEWLLHFWDDVVKEIHEKDYVPF